LICVIALIVCGSLYPWNFTPGPGNPWLVLLHSWPPPAWNPIGDASNVAIYVPLGAVAFLALVRRFPRRTAAVASVAIGLSLSAGMELLQYYVPGRGTDLIDVLCNGVGVCLGASVAWRHPKPGGRFQVPILLLACWVLYHFYPFIPSVGFERTTIELGMWFHPQSLSPIDSCRYAAEWLAVGTAANRLFGHLRLWWGAAAFALHFMARPIFISRPFVLEEIAGLLLATALWPLLSERARSAPWFLIAIVVLREYLPRPWLTDDSTGGWIPFDLLFASKRGAAFDYLLRTTFDFAAMLWFWHLRGMSWRRAGAILAGLLGAVALVKGVLTGHGPSTTDPALALLLALTLHELPEPETPSAGTGQSG
jgi:VanZ family protein